MLKNILAAFFLSLVLGRTRAQFQVSIASVSIKLLNFYAIDHTRGWMTLSFNDGPRLTRIVCCIVQKDTFTSNAYYTDASRNMIDYPAQLTALRSYLHEHLDSSLLSLFVHNAKPFAALAPEVSARSILSARCFQLIEDTKGIAGVKTFINCGRGDDNYFAALYALTGINRTNFDTRLRALLTH